MVGDIDAAVLVVELDHGGIPGAEAEAGVSLPVVVEPADGVELYPVALGQEAEQPACLDRSQLGRVADQDQLPARLGDEGGEALEFPGADHPSFVDHHHLTSAQLPLRAAAVVFVEELGDRFAWQAGLVGKDAGGHR